MVVVGGGGGVIPCSTGSSTPRGISGDVLGEFLNHRDAIPIVGYQFGSQPSETNGNLIILSKNANAFTRVVYFFTEIVLWKTICSFVP